MEIFDRFSVNMDWCSDILRYQALIKGLSLNFFRVYKPTHKTVNIINSLKA